MSTRIKPVGYKLLVIPKERKNTTTNGIELVNLTLMEGEVVEVSEYLKDIYKVGDTVLFPKGSGNEHFHDGKSYLFLNGQEVPAGDVWALEYPE